MNNFTSLDYVEKALILAQKRYAEIKSTNPGSPLLQMYDSVVQQLFFLKNIIIGKEKINQNYGK